MPRLKSANNAQTQLAESITNAATSFTVQNASVLPDAPFRATIDDEIIEVGAIDKGTDILSSVIRGVEDTTPAAHDAGADIENRFTAGTHGELADGVELVKIANGTWSDTTTSIPAGSDYTKTMLLNFPAQKGRLIMTGRTVAGAGYAGVLVEFDNNPSHSISIACNGNNYVSFGMNEKLNGYINLPIFDDKGYIVLKYVFIDGINLRLIFHNNHSSAVTLTVAQCFWEVEG